MKGRGHSEYFEDREGGRAARQHGGEHLGRIGGRVQAQAAYVEVDEAVFLNNIIMDENQRDSSTGKAPPYDTYSTSVSSLSSPLLPT